MIRLAGANTSALEWTGGVRHVRTIRSVMWAIESSPLPKGQFPRRRISRRPPSPANWLTLDYAGGVSLVTCGSSRPKQITDS
jgi:hypothetical protein